MKVDVKITVDIKSGFQQSCVCRCSEFLWSFWMFCIFGDLVPLMEDVFIGYKFLVNETEELT